MSGFNASMQKGLVSSRSGFANTGKQLSKYVTLPLLAAAAASVKLAMDFEQAMTKVQALSGASAAQTEAWGKSILDLAGKVGRPPQELAEALYQVSSSGVEASKVIGVVETSAKAAAAGLGDTAVIADLVTSAMNAYAKEALSAAEVTDTLVEAVKLGKGEAADFAPVLGQILPVSSELGVSFSDVAAAMASMTTTGIDAAEGATRLRAIFSSLLKVTPAQEKAFQAVGLSAEGLRASLDERGLLPTLQLIKKAVGDDTTALAAMFPNVRALQGVLALVGQNGENVGRIFKDMADSTGALDRAFKITTGDSAFQMQQAFANIQVAAIKMGQALLPIVTNIINVFGALFEEIARLPTPILDLLIVFGSLVAAIGPLIYIFAKVPLMIAAIKVAFNSMGSLVTNPLFMVIAGLVVAIYAFNKALNASKEAHREWVKQVTEASNVVIENLDRFANRAQLNYGILQHQLRAVLGEYYGLYQFITNHSDTFTGEDNIAELRKNLVGDEEAIQKFDEALKILEKTAASAFKQGNIDAEEFAFLLQGIGRSAEYTTNRLLQASTTLKGFDITGTIDAVREFGVVSDESRDKLLAMTELMASRGELTSTQFADALIKLGFT